jgi:hypothetical protein
VVQAKTFHCGAGDVQCLIDAINTANTNGTTNTIHLAAGTYTLRAVNNDIFFDPNGLPVITSLLTITGQGAETTIIERDAHAPAFRLLQVATTGSLTLKRLTLRSGRALFDGGGIYNHGTLLISHSTITNNEGDSGGGIYNQGTLDIRHSTFTNNLVAFGGGGIYNAGSVHLTHSTLTDNVGGHGGGGLFNFGGTAIIAGTTFTGNVADGGGGVDNHSDVFFLEHHEGFMSITNSTFAENRGTVAGGIVNGGTMFLTNSTLARNEAGLFGSGGGLANYGTVILQNTILALNTQAFPPPPAFDEASDCAGVVTSLGNNLIGAPASCTITLRPSDLIGAPGLDTFTDDGTPGHGHFPLLQTSQAIDAGNDVACPRRDQIGQRRINIPSVGRSRCDIGAIEFPGKGDRPHDEEEKHHDQGLAAAAWASQ